MRLAKQLAFGATYRGVRARSVVAAGSVPATPAATARTGTPPLQLLSRSEGETLAWGYHLGAASAAGDCVLLTGAVGRGKSVFARGFVRGVVGDPNVLVTSPTFTLMNAYAKEGGQNSKNSTSSNASAQQVVHMDLYRLARRADELPPLGLPQLFQQGAAAPGGPRDTCFVVEWPEQLHEAGWPASYLLVSVARLEGREEATGGSETARSSSSSTHGAAATSSNHSPHAVGEGATAEVGDVVEEDDAPRVLTLTVVEAGAPGAEAAGHIAALLERFKVTAGLV